MQPYKDKVGHSEMFIIRSAENRDGWTWKFIIESRAIIFEYWYDSDHTLKRIRVRNAACQKYWPDEAKDELDKMVSEGRIKLEECLYFKHRE